MERIKNVMQRLQELYYSKHQKTSIDIDLMLDYTRVMYADLLEWRKDFKEEPQTNEDAEKNTGRITSEAEKEAGVPGADAESEDAAAAPEAAEPAEDEAVPADTASPSADTVVRQEETTPAGDNAEPAAGEEEQQGEEVKEAGPAGKNEDATDEEAAPEDDAAQEETEAPPQEEQVEAEVQEENDLEQGAKRGKEPVAEEGGDVTAASRKLAAENPQFHLPIERDEPAPLQPAGDEGKSVVKETPEADGINALHKDNTGISFEPPTQAEQRSEIKDELLVTVPSQKAAITETEVPVPDPLPLPDMNRQATESSVRQPEPARYNPPAQRKDIRTAIGINDKYLFLNELFNNHKSNYEETLDKLNLLSNYDEATDWIRTKVAPEFRWDKEDATVESFYGVLAKHFSAR